jgi:hypothetical protein
MDRARAQERGKALLQAAADQGACWAYREAAKVIDDTREQWLILGVEVALASLQSAFRIKADLCESRVQMAKALHGHDDPVEPEGAP